MEGASGDAPGRTASVANTFAELSLPPLFSRVQHPRGASRLALCVAATRGPPTRRSDPTCPNRSREHAHPDSARPAGQPCPDTPVRRDRACLRVLCACGGASRTVSDQTLSRAFRCTPGPSQHVARDLPTWPGNSNIWRPTMRAADTRTVVTQLPLTTDKYFGPGVGRVWTVWLRPPPG